ncbi:GTP-binding protein [Telmatospirillum sp.]|uniref:GTP-binding protein n=1 Tax=Telmatospirillum sp. TaxID=2079197 RepID=UPI00283E9A88|nr:GTP-binding protein [Telmatospirillum sp.]MDR3440524.1 GTP-binding protein [Telmatospirillum sp.]
MRLVTVSGPPSSGKTAVLLNVIRELRKTGKTVGVVKFDCLSTEDDRVYASLGVTVRVGLSGNLCPDHYFVCNIDECVAWGVAQGFDYLLSESAGLCNRCAPHAKGVLAVCVIDNLMGLNTPKKIGPMLKFADVVVVTKGDIVSQAEREVFAFKVRQANPRAKIAQVNGITGQGAHGLATLFAGAPETSSLNGGSLRFTMPAALCSYCLGETKIGADYQTGNIKRIKV